MPHLDESRRVLRLLCIRFHACICAFLNSSRSPMGWHEVVVLRLSVFWQSQRGRGCRLARATYSRGLAAAPMASQRKNSLINSVYIFGVLRFDVGHEHQQLQRQRAEPLQWHLLRFEPLPKCFLAWRNANFVDNLPVAWARTARPRELRSGAFCGFASAALFFATEQNHDAPKRLRSYLWRLFAAFPRTSVGRPLLMCSRCFRTRAVCRRSLHL